MVKQSAHEWSPTARPKLARGVFLLRAGPPPETTDTWEIALVEKARRLDLDEPLPRGPALLRDNLQYGRPFRLNYTSAQTVAWCDGRRTVAELEQQVTERMGCTPGQARRAVHDVLNFMAHNGMLDGWRRRLRHGLFFLNPLRLVRGLRYYVGYHAFHRYR